MGKDTHAASTPAQRTALEVLAANGVETVVQPDDGFIPTPVISRAILVHNRGGKDGFADGVIIIIITPSHGPPNGGPMERDVMTLNSGRANGALSRRMR